MILDNIVSGGQHIAPNWTSSAKDKLTSDYGAFLKINDDATVERTDQRTGKTGCAVTYQANLQELAGKLLKEGSTKRVQVLLRRITREGRIITRRQVYTVQRSSSGSFIASFGLTTEDMAAARRPRHICLFAFSGGCLAWSR
jgi:hypothetical protein